MVVCIVIVDLLSFNSAVWINVSYTLLEDFRGIYDGPAQYGSATRYCLKELLETVYALFLKPHAHPFGHGLRT